MKCPTCGNESDQQQLGPDEQGEPGYRCAACGRLYTLSALSEIQKRLAELKAKANAMVAEQQKLQDQIAQAEASLEEARRRG